MPENESPTAGQIDELIALEKAREEREKSKAFSQACFGLAWLLIVGLLIYLNWPLVRLWLGL